MAIVFEIKGKQFIIKNEKDKIFLIPFQKKLIIGSEVKGSEIGLKVLSEDENFGQPYLKNIDFDLKINRHPKKKKIVTMKYKSKTRSSARKIGSRVRGTEIEIISIKRS